MMITNDSFGQSIQNVVDCKVIQAKSEVATEVLTVLRQARDNAEEEWDSLVRAHPELCNLWDRLREIAGFNA